jgi:GT2 family glycosyltransferase
VDNGSGDDCESIFRNSVSAENVEILQTGKNLGFAGGNNYGFNHVRSQELSYILFINNDTIVEPGFLEPLVEALQQNTTIACATGLICYFPEKETIWYGGGTWSPLRTSSYTRLQGRSVSSLKSKKIEYVSFVSGCLMLINKEVLNLVGGFNEQFFMYVEDTELSIRLLSHGYRLAFVPASCIYHKIIHRNTSSIALYYNIRNRLLLASSILHGWRKIFAILYVLFTTNIKMFLWIFTRRNFAIAAWKGIRDYFIGKFYEGEGIVKMEMRDDK